MCRPPRSPTPRAFIPSRGQKSHYSSDNCWAKHHRDAQDQQQFLCFPANPGWFVHFLPKSELTQVDVGSHSLMPAATLNSKEVDDLVSYLLHTGDGSAKRSPAHSSRSDDHDD